MLLLSTIPLWVLIYDGYRQGKLNIGINRVLLFVLLIAVSMILLMAYKLQFVFSIPVLLLIFLVLFSKRK